MSRPAVAAPRCSVDDPDAFVDDLLEVVTAATWPGGSPLVDVDPGVLRARLRPQLARAAYSYIAQQHTSMTRRLRRL